MKSKPIPSELVYLERMMELCVDDEEEGFSDMEPGVYAVDSRGGVWKLERTMTEVFKHLTPEKEMAPDDLPRRKKNP